MFEHTDRLMAASARWLHEATVDTVSDDLKIAAVAISGYNALQAVQAPHPGPLSDHPLASIVSEGAALLGLSESDAKLGLALIKWDDFGRYHFEPSPATLEEALAWAGRVRDAALKLQIS